MSKRPQVSIVVALGRNGVIGRDNAMPWHLPEDLRHFKATTLGQTIIMGRRTFESIGRALPGRKTMVVTANPQWHADGVEVARSLTDAIDRAGEVPDVFVVGGAGLFEEALGLAYRLIVTEVDAEPVGDVRFPPIDPSVWRKIPGTRLVGASGLGYTICSYERHQPL